MEMKVTDWLEPGDHTCFICDVVAYKNFRDGYALHLDLLREKKLISA
jgi:hypothetical protein